MSGDAVPNPIYGWGRIDARAALWEIFPLRLQKRAAAPVSFPGDTITYFLRLRNLTLDIPISGIVVSDTLPAGTSLVSTNPPSTLTGDRVTWDIPRLDPGEQTVLELVVQTAEDAPAGILYNSQYGAVYNGDLERTGRPVGVFIASHRLFLPLMGSQVIQ
jgi:uncharacterized repeat protein (TIGR01451 family)